MVKSGMTDCKLSQSEVSESPKHADAAAVSQQRQPNPQSKQYAPDQTSTSVLHCLRSILSTAKEISGSGPTTQQRPALSDWCA